MCAKLRQTKTTPIIMLTARGEESNRVQGFEVGADDYVVKAFQSKRSNLSGAGDIATILGGGLFVETITEQ